MKKFEDYPGFIKGILAIIVFGGCYLGAGLMLFLPGILFDRRIIGVFVLKILSSLSIAIAAVFYFKMKEKNKDIRYLVYMIEGNLAQKGALGIKIDEAAVEKGAKIMNQSLPDTGEGWMQSKKNEDELFSRVFYLVNKFGNRY